MSGIFSDREAQALISGGLRELEDDMPSVVYGTKKLTQRPIIVGAGPAGLFCALLLAENGYNPYVIERGGSVPERATAVSQFYKNRILDEDSNIQFGAGGAGTFSDGTLMTRINDPRIAYILRRFVSFGAPKEILTQARPHIGTDVLRTVIENMTKQIESCGATVSYHTKLTDILSDTVVTSKGNLPYEALVLATGHSARDTYEMLMKRDFTLQAKPFSVGMRIEHLQSDVDFSMYGKFSGNPALGHAEYSLSCDTKTRGVYTFCMCPGGEVVAATSEVDGVVVNGMSHYARDGKNANSAIAVSVKTSDYGASVEGALAFQRNIEKAAFQAAGNNYNVPLITVGDFIAGKCETLPSKVVPTYMGGDAYKIVDPNTYLPSFVTAGLANAISSFDKRMKGFADPNAILCGPETRTSAPIRILRDGQSFASLTNCGVYPCGEGAGYAGGITSAAVDGIRTAYAIMQTYKPML
ncbi:MAG: FAD-dependent oxidoreductase [Clostridia bacterium]|nr:FAD-dependent oxidoreductase [Clostridia bacterium]